MDKGSLCSRRGTRGISPLCSNAKLNSPLSYRAQTIKRTPSLGSVSKELNTNTWGSTRHANSTRVWDPSGPNAAPILRLSRPSLFHLN